MRVPRSEPLHESVLVLTANGSAPLVRSKPVTLAKNFRVSLQPRTVSAFQGWWAGRNARVDHITADWITADWITEVDLVYLKSSMNVPLSATSNRGRQ